MGVVRSRWGAIALKFKSDEFKRRLTSTAEDAARDALLAVEAIAVRVRITRLRAFAEIDAAPERHEVFRDNLERELEELRAAFTCLRAPFDRLNVRREAVEERGWWSSVDDELDRHRQQTKRLRALIRTPVRRVLPAAPDEEAWIVELRATENGVESRYALIEANGQGA